MPPAPANARRPTAIPRDGADILPDRIIKNIGADDDPSNRPETDEAFDRAVDEEKDEDDHERLDDVETAPR